MDGKNIQTYFIGDKIQVSNDTYKKPVAQIGGYKFKWCYQAKTTGRHYWQCINYNKKHVAKCNAVIYTNGINSDSIIIEIKNVHNHSGDSTAVERKKTVRNNEKQIPGSNPQRANRRGITQVTAKAAANLKRVRFLATYRRQQPWLLPDSIIYYIAKNPSLATVYEKLIKSCKYFFIQNPILFVKCLTSTSYSFNQSVIKYDELHVDLKTVSCKIWVTHKLSTSNYSVNKQSSLSTITPKIYQSDIKKLTVYGQTCFLNDIISLATKCETVVFEESIVIDEVSNTIVVLEKLFEYFPKIKKFE